MEAVLDREVSMGVGDVRGESILAFIPDGNGRLKALAFEWLCCPATIMVHVSSNCQEDNLGNLTNDATPFQPSIPHSTLPLPILQYTNGNASRPTDYQLLARNTPTTCCSLPPA